MSFVGKNNAKITNRANCGGNKKAGLAPTIGYGPFALNAIRMKGVQTSSNYLFCPVNFSNNPGGQTSGGVGRMYSRQYGRGFNVANLSRNSVAK